jgi:hypothetical protein
MKRHGRFQRSFAPDFELACSFHTAWRLADPALRADIELIIRTYTRRHPLFRSQLRTALGCYTPGFQQSTDRRTTIAAALHAIWQLADASLRTELEQVIRRYVRREPDRIRDFQRALTDVKYPKSVRIERIQPDG